MSSFPPVSSLPLQPLLPHPGLCLEETGLQDPLMSCTLTQALPVAS